jgi:GR25 family glycosyltransferase involved in LPS biosynthesis
MSFSFKGDMDILILVSTITIVITVVVLIHFNAPTRSYTVDMFHDGVITGDSFDVYLINMGKNVDRLNNFVEQYKKSDLSFKSMYRYEAIDGRTVKIKDYVSPRAYAEIMRAEKTGTRTKHYQLTPGGVGCYLSHQNVMKIVSESKNEFAIIFEDDCIIDAHIYEKMTDIMHEIPSDWDILLLGCHCIRCLKYEKYTDIDRFFQTHGYVINNKSAAKIYDHLSKMQIEAQIDTVLSNMIKQGLIKVYCLNNMLVHQDSSFATTIQVPIDYKSGEDPYDILAH